MGKAARAKRERRPAAPPVAAKEQQAPADPRKVAMLATGALVLVVAIVVGALLATRSSSSTPGPAKLTDEDRSAPASLVEAADKVGSIAQQQVGFWSIVRDAALGVPSLIVLLWPPRRLSVDAALLGRPDRFTVQPS